MLKNKNVERSLSLLISICIVLSIWYPMFLTGAKGEVQTYGDTYLLKITIDGKENVTFADHTNSATDGNWIYLQGGDNIELPSFTFTYNGINRITHTSDNRTIHATLNLENYTDHIIQYPYTTHAMYTDVAGKRDVSIDLRGSTDLADKDVDVYLVQATPSSLKNTIYDLIDGDTSTFRNLLNNSQLTLQNQNLDSSGDASIDFGTLSAGDYAVFALLNSSYLANPQDLFIISATGFEVMEYDSIVTAPSIVEFEDNVNVDVELIDAPNSTSYTYGALLINKNAYRADILLSCNGTEEGTSLAINGEHIGTGFDLVSMIDILNFNANDVQSKLTSIVGPENGTVVIKTESKDNTRLSLTTLDLPLGDYILLVGVYSSDEYLVAFNQSEVQISNIVSGTLKGTVTDTIGTPVNDVNISIDGIQQATTGPDGKYLIADITPGMHTLIASCPGYIDNSTNMDIQTEFSTLDLVLELMNRAPELDTIGSRTIDEGQTLTVTLSATDLDEDDLTYSMNATFGTLTDDTFTWTPTFDDEGSYTAEFSVSDGTMTDSETININVNGVNRAPTIETIEPQAVNESQVIIFTVNATDPDEDDLSYSADNLPEGAAFDEVNNTFSWTPGYDQAGDYTIDFRVTDGTDESTETVTITVNNLNRAPTLSVIGQQDIDENATLAFTIDAIELDGDALTYSAENLPEGAGLGSDTGMFAWTPTYEQAGTHQIKFMASDGTEMDEETVTIIVHNVNRPPVIQTIGVQIIDEGSLLTIAILADDPDGNTLTYSTDFEFGKLVNNVFTWTPGYEQAGEYSISFKTTDGAVEVEEIVQITVMDVNRPPVLNPISDILIAEGEIITLDLIAEDPDGDSLTYSKDVDYGTMAGNEFTWMTGFEDNGLHYIEFTVTDGNLSDKKKVLVAVGNTNRPPVLNTIAQKTVNENEELTFTMEASDEDGDTLVYSAEELPEGANLDVSSGVFTWTPTYEQAGTYSFDLNVRDSIYRAVETVQITVIDVNRNPVLDSMSDIESNEMDEIVIHLNGSDPDNDPLMYSKNVTFGTLVGSEFTWTPGYYENGTHYIEFTVTDGILSDKKTVFISVNDVNMPPEFYPMIPRSVYENSNLTFTIRANDGDGDSLEYFAMDLPEGATLNNSTGLFLWKPTYSQAGAYSVEFKVTDGILVDSETMSITVRDREPSWHEKFEGFDTSGGSSGGGGSPGTGENYDNIEAKDYASRYVVSGIDSSYKFEKDENSIDYINFTALKTAGEVKAIIEVLNGTSSLVRADPPGVVYQNMNIWVGDSSFTMGGYIPYAEIKFKVEKSWLEENGIDASTIRLCRHNNNMWKKLPTEKRGEDETYVYFRSATPGFSPFAITGESEILYQPIENAPTITRPPTLAEPVGNMNSTTPSSSENSMEVSIENEVTFNNILFSMLRIDNKGPKLADSLAAIVEASRNRQVSNPANLLTLLSAMAWFSLIGVGAYLKKSTIDDWRYWGRR